GWGLWVGVVGVVLGGGVGCWGRPGSQPRDDREDDLFRPLLEEIINLRHPLVRLAGEIDWDFLGGRFSSVCRVGPGQPPLPTRLVPGCSFSSICTTSPTRRCASDGWRTRISSTSVGKWCSGTSCHLIARRSRAGASGWVR